MAKISILYLFCLVLPHFINCETCEICEVTEQLQETKAKLRECERKLEESECSSYLGRVTKWMSSSQGGKDTLKTTVQNFLQATTLDTPSPNYGPKSVKVSISLTQDELKALRRFVNNDVGREDVIQDILMSSINVDNSVNMVDFSWISSFLEHESFVICQIVIMAAAVIVLLWKKVKVWRIGVLVLVTSVAVTWIRLYKVALAKKQATLNKLASVPQNCLVEKQGWLSAISDATYSFLGIKDKQCEAYYEALMVNPLWDVTPLQALSETVSQFVLRPLEMCGASLGVFFNEVLAPIPFIWKIPALVIAFIIILMCLLMLCRYKIKSPLLFSIEPSSPSSSKGNLLKKTVKDAIKESKKQTIKEPEKGKELPYPTTPGPFDKLLQPEQNSYT